MVALSLLVASIALADSINPSTVLPALYLASTPSARGLSSFTAGVFAASFAGGLVLVLGPGPALIASLRDMGPDAEHAVEAAVGAALLVLAVAAWRSRGRAAPDGRARRAVGPRAAFALGVGIMALELPTAFLYFGAVSAIVVAHVAVPVQVVLVAAYNVLFVLPLVAILSLRLLAGDQAERRVAAARAWLGGPALAGVAAVAGSGGAVLTTVALSGLLLAR